MFTKLNLMESGYFGAKIDIFIKKKPLKNGKSQIYNSFWLIQCNFITV